MTFSPATAAQIASAVYGIRELSSVERGIVRAEEDTLLASGDFDFGRGKAVTGSSGAGIRRTSGFSMVVPCKRSENGQAFGACACRGIGCPDPNASPETTTGLVSMKPRVYVLDVDAGIAVGFVMWVAAWTDFHMFKVRDGSIVSVHANLSDSATSGWE